MCVVTYTKHNACALLIVAIDVIAIESFLVALPSRWRRRTSGRPSAGRRGASTLSPGAFGAPPTFLELRSLCRGRALVKPMRVVPIAIEERATLGALNDHHYRYLAHAAGAARQMVGEAEYKRMIAFRKGMGRTKHAIRHMLRDAVVRQATLRMLRPVKTDRCMMQWRRCEGRRRVSARATTLQLIL